MNIQKELGLIIRSSRYGAGLSQKQLARKMRTKQAAISRAERHGVSSINWFIKYINACGDDVGFHHVSVGKKNECITYFLGGMHSPAKR